MNHNLAKRHDKQDGELSVSYICGITIIDYHCHLQPSRILEDTEFGYRGMWPSGDHYKWRAMRLGIPEELITGSASYHEKYLAFASILPSWPVIPFTFGVRSN